MTKHVYSVTSLVGTSQESMEDAIRHAIATAGKSVRNLDWFEVKEIRGHIENGRIGHYQVKLDLGFRYEEK